MNYEVKVYCTNCGYGEASFKLFAFTTGLKAKVKAYDTFPFKTIQIPKGTEVCETKCPECACKTLINF